MARGSIGVNTGTIINVRYRRNNKPRPCDCKRCKFGREVDGIIYCMATGDVDVKKRSCKFYSGPYIHRPKKSIKTKKVKRRPRKSNS